MQSHTIDIIFYFYQLVLMLRSDKENVHNVVGNLKLLEDLDVSLNLEFVVLIGTQNVDKFDQID